ncbi:MAG: hypothetical protein Kow0092_06820 [Deferrisomatales bacterium]
MGGKGLIHPSPFLFFPLYVLIQGAKPSVPETCGHFRAPDGTKGGRWLRREAGSPVTTKGLPRLVEGPVKEPGLGGPRGSGTHGPLGGRRALPLPARRSDLPAGGPLWSLPIGDPI